MGGALLGQSFLRLDLVDEIRLMIAPVILGDGLHLSGDGGTGQKWQLTNIGGQQLLELPVVRK